MEAAVEGAELLPVQVKPHRLDLTLLGQTFFAVRLLERLRPASVRGVALCTQDDEALREGIRSLPQHEGRSRHLNLRYGGCVFHPPIAALGFFAAAWSVLMNASRCFFLSASPSAQSLPLSAMYSGKATSPAFGFSPDAISSSARRA